MVLVTLRRNAPEVASLGGCDLCGRDDPAGAGDHLLVGQPGTATRDFCLCRACGDVLASVVRECGSQLTVVVQGDDRGVANKVGLPEAQQMEAPEDETPVHAEVDEARRHLQQEARALAHAEQTLRSEAERLEEIKQRLSSPPRR